QDHEREGAALPREQGDSGPSEGNPRGQSGLALPGAQVQQGSRGGAEGDEVRPRGAGVAQAAVRAAGPTRNGVAAGCVVKRNEPQRHRGHRDKTTQREKKKEETSRTEESVAAISSSTFFPFSSSVYSSLGVLCDSVVRFRRPRPWRNSMHRGFCSSFRT